MKSSITLEKKSLFAIAIDGSSHQSYVFKPNREFYEHTKIGRKRYGQIYRGEKSPLLEEVVAICNYLDISLDRFIKNKC